MNTIAPDESERTYNMINSQIDGLIDLCNTLQTEPAVVQSLEQTRKEMRKSLLKATSGAMQLPKSVRSALVVASTVNSKAPIRVTQVPAVLGRSDQCEVNVAPMLPANQTNSISRQQVKFTQENGIWMVQLHENASMPCVYLNKVQITKDRPVSITQGAILAFGPDVKAPVLELYLMMETR
jgi:hypothetical protein